MALSRITDQVKLKEDSEWLRQQSVVMASCPSGGESVGLTLEYLLSPARKEDCSLIMAEQCQWGGLEVEQSLNFLMETWLTHLPKC